MIPNFRNNWAPNREDFLNSSFKPAIPPQAPSGVGSVVASAVPGVAGLSQSASQITKDLLGGLPATSTSRRAAAYFGNQSGVPGSQYAINRGYDIYGQQAQANKQQGIQNLLQLMAGLTAPALQERQQQIAQDQFAASQAQNAAQFSADYRLRKMQADKLYGPKFRGVLGIAPKLKNFQLSPAAAGFQAATGVSPFAQ